MLTLMSIETQAQIKNDSLKPLDTLTTVVHIQQLRTANEIFAEHRSFKKMLIENDKHLSLLNLQLSNMTTQRNNANKQLSIVIEQKGNVEKQNTKLTWITAASLTLTSIISFFAITN